MNFRHLTVLFALLPAPAALAAGDAASGESNFKKCKACHMIMADDGSVIVKGGKTGPNLYGVVGRAIGSTDYSYSDSLRSVGDAGLVWDEAELVAYITDPKAWLKEKTGDAAAKTKMAFKLNKGQEDMAAYLASLNP
ncbi:MAG: cytochrome C [Albidovulum sp.]